MIDMDMDMKDMVKPFWFFFNKNDEHPKIITLQSFLASMITF